MPLYICGMATIPQFDPALLIGTWRLVKIQWRDKKVTNFNNPDKWQELTFKPGGTLEERHKHNKDSPVSTYSAKWRVEKHKIIVNSMDTDRYMVEHLTDKGLVLKFIS